MLPMLHKHVAITAALLASLSLVGCGKKTDVFGDDKVPMVEKTQKDQQKTSQDQKMKGDLGGGLPLPDAQGDEDYPPLPEPLPKNPPPVAQNPSEDPAEDLPLPLPVQEDKPARPTPPPAVVDAAPVPRDHNQLPRDYHPQDATNVTREGLSKRLTGGVTEDGLVYTSSSTDDLLNFIRLRNERVDYATREANLRAAASVLSAQLVADKFSDEALVVLKIKEGSHIRTYRLGGALSAGPASALRKIKAGTTGNQSLDGTLKCLDLDGGCDTSFARLRIGDPGSSSIINVVFRRSVADLYFHLPKDYSGNGEYLRLREFIRNSILGVQTQTKLQGATMSSYEVVNGRSGITLSMKGLNRELLAFSGPLLAPEVGTAVNVVLARVAQDQEDSLDLLARDNSKLTYANWIGQARLIANNGLGQVRIALKMRQRGNYKPETFAVTFMRQIKPIVNLTDANLK